jgi:hypothetical protein
MKEKSVIASFKDIADQKPVIVKSAGELILEIVKKAPKTDFNQKMFREKLLTIEGAATSNPAINGALRKLADNGLITREVQGKSVFYRHIKQTKK